MKKKYLIVTISLLLIIVVSGIGFVSTQSQAKGITEPSEYQIKLEQAVTKSLKDAYFKGKPMPDSTIIKPSGEISNVKILKQVKNKSSVQVLYRFTLNNKLKYGLCDVLLDSWRVSRNTNLSPTSEPVQMMLFHTSRYVDVLGFIKKSDSVKTIRITYEDGKTESINATDEYMIFYPKHENADLKTVEVLDQSGVLKIHPMVSQ
jgi:hypothetical protein